MSGSNEIAVPSRVGVMGGGRMGGGIAHAFLLAGAYVVVVERDQLLVQNRCERIDARRLPRRDCLRERLPFERNLRR